MPHDKNEIACTISHLLIFEKLVKENIDTAIILEDDVVINDGFYQIMKLQNEFPNQYELLYYHHGKAKFYPTLKKIYENYKLVRYRRQSKSSIRSICYSSVYQITRRGALKLLQYAYPIIMPIDIFLGHLNIHHLKAYGIEPSCSPQNINTFTSDIGERDN